MYCWKCGRQIKDENDGQSISFVKDDNYDGGDAIQFEWQNLP